MTIKRHILFVASLFITLTIQAQKLTVESMTLADNDISARQYERKDLNGQVCALVKVSLPSLGVKFEGNVIEPVEYKTGEYWVYMSKGSRELRIKHPLTQPLHVKFIDYNIKSVESRATYNLSVQMPTIEEGVPMAKADDPQLPDWLNSQNPNQWIGISPPTTDRKKARSAAIINAVLGYLRSNKEGGMQGLYKSNGNDSANPETTIIEDSIQAMVTYHGFNCEVIKEYYNYRGEYFVLCGFVDYSQSKNYLEIIQSINNKTTDKTETLQAKGEINLLLNDRRLSCSFECKSSHDSISTCQIKINGEPLIPVTDMVYNKYQWKQAVDGSLLTFTSYEVGQSLGVVTLLTYGLLPFIPKSLKCQAMSEGQYKEGSLDFLTFKWINTIKADTLCYPIPIHFVSLTANRLTINFGNVNLHENEIETNEGADGEIGNGREIQQSVHSFPYNYDGCAIIRILKTIGLYGDLIRFADIRGTHISNNGAFFTSNSNRELYNIGVRWYFENMPTQEQYRKMTRQYMKTRKHPRWPGFFIAAKYNKDQ